MKNLAWIIPVVIAVLGLVALMSSRSNNRKLDWTPNFKVNDKRPMGLYIFHRELINNQSKINVISALPSEYFSTQYSGSDNLPNALMYINPYADYSDNEWNEILKAVQNGLQLFLSVQQLPRTLEERLQVEMGSKFDTVSHIHLTLNQDSFPVTARKEYGHFVANIYNIYVEYDTLGFLKNKFSKSINFIKIPYGKGEILVHSNPEVFTNYYLLRGQTLAYVNSILTKVKTGRIAWFVPGITNKNSSSQLSFIFSEYALKWAFLLSILGIALFILFNARRRQWIVPVIVPEENTTVEFARTISNLFLKNGSPQEILEMRRHFILDKLKGDYFISINDPGLISKLVKITGASEMDVKSLIYQLAQIENSHFPDANQQLINLDNLINRIFYDNK